VRAYADALQKNKTITDEAKAQLRKLGFSGREFTYDNLMNFSNKLLARASLSPGAELQSFIGKGLKSFSIQIPLGVPQLGAMTLGVSELNREWSFGLTVQGPVQATVGFTMKLLRLSWPSKADDQLRPEKPSWWPEFSLQNTLLERTFFTMAALGGAAALFSGSSALIKRVTKGGNFVSTIFSQAASALNTAAVYAMRYSLALPELVALASKGFRSMLMQQTAESTIGHGENKAEILERISANNKDARGELRQRVEKHVKEGGKKPLLGWYFLNRDRFMHDSLVQLRETLGSDTFRGRQLPGGMKVAGALGLVAAGLTAAVATMGLLFGFNKDNVFDRIVGDYVGDRAMHSARAFKADPVLMAQSGQKQPTPQKHGFGSMLANFISNTLFGTQETLVQVGPFALYGSPASFVRGTGFLGYNVDSAESMDYYARVKDKDLQVIARGYVQLSRIVPFDLSVSQGTTGIKQNQTAEAAIRNHLNFLRNDPRRVQMAAPLRARSRYLNYYSGVETLTPASQMVIAQRKNMGDWLIYQDELSLANYLGYGYQRQEVDYADTEMRYLKGSLVAPGLSKLFSRYFNSLIRQSIQSATVPEVDFDYDENYRPSALRNRPGLNLDNPMSSWFNLLAAGTLAAIGGGAYIYARSMEASLVNIALTNLLVNSEDNYARLKHWGINSLDDFSASVKSARFYVTNYGRHFYTFGRDAARMSDSAHVRELIQHGVISVEKVGGQVKGVSAIFHNLSTIQEANRLGQTGNLDNLKSELLTSVESEIKRIKTVLEKFDSDTALEQLKGQYGKTLEAAHGHLEKLHGYLSGLEAKQMTVDEFMKSKLIGLGRIELLSGLGYQQISVWSILKNNFKDLARSEWKRFKSQMNTFFEIDTANISTATRVKGAASKAVVATAAKLREAGQNIAFWVLGEGPDANANRDPQAVGSPETEAAPAPSPSEPLEPGAGRSLLSKMSAGLMKFTGLLMGSFAYLAWNLLPMLRSFSPFRSNELAGEKELAENTRRVAAKASIIDVKENLSSAASISVLAFGASRLIGPTSALGMSAYNKAAERYNNTWLGRRAQATILDQDKVITPTREARGKFSTQGLIAAGAFAVAGAAVYGFASGGDAKTALYGAKHWGAVGLNLVGLAAVGAALLAVATAAATGGAAAAGVTVIGFGLLYAGGLLLDKLGHGLADTSLGKRVLRFFDSFDPDPDTLRKANENFLIHGVNTALSGAYQGFRSFLSYVPRKLLKWVKTYRMETPQQERGKLSELWYGMMEWVGLSLSVTPYSGTDQLEGSEDQFESTTHPSNAYLWNYPATFRLPPGSAFGAASKMPFWLGPLSEGLQLWAQNTRDRQKKDGSAENDLTTDWFSADVLSPGVRRDFYASKLTSDYSATAGNLSVLTATSIRVLQERAFYAIPIMKQMQGDENNRLFFSGAGLENPAPSYPRDKVPQQKSKGWLNWLKGFFGEAAEAATLSDSRAGRIHLLRPQKGSGHKVPEARGYYTPKTTAIQPSGVPFDSGFFVTSQYGVKRGDRTHMGIDLVPKREGDTAIRAAAGGRVKHIGYQDSGYGNWIEITNSRGISQRYAHMATRPSLRVGDTVIKGQTIGQMGSTGHSSGPHVHFEVLVNQRKINPNEFLNLAADATAAVAKRVKQRGGRVNSQGKLGHPPPHVRVTVDKKNDHPVHQPGIPKRRKADAVRAVKDPNSNKVSLELHHHDDYAWGIMYDPYQTGTDMLAIDPYAAC
jgi:murein DD-endopeptidase MepM/ murein hydrolase activator NlpD